MKNKEFIKNNKKIIEAQLTVVLSKICKKLGMRLAEWDLDEALYKAILPHAKDAALLDLFTKYDTLYDVAEVMHVDVNSALVWFRGMNKPAQKQLIKKVK